MDEENEGNHTQYCDNCGAEINPEGSFCTECGTEISASEPDSNPADQENNRNEDNTKFCKKCGEEIPISAKVCPKCGEPLKKKKPSERETKYCVSCGESVLRKAEICPHCGVRIQSSGTSDRVTAALLAILIGVFGAHKFYLGKNAQGVLYLCFFWIFIPGIVAFIEGLIYLTESDAEFKRKHVD